MDKPHRWGAIEELVMVGAMMARLAQNDRLRSLLLQSGRIDRNMTGIDRIWIRRNGKPLGLFLNNIRSSFRLGGPMAKSTVLLGDSMIGGVQ
jgi:predicted NAD-dependent protein-ADP-ribosyltransferase YbiA (DUF1768 family)